METNEALKTALIQEAEVEMIALLKGVQKLTEGDLKGVEHEVLTRMFAASTQRTGTRDPGANSGGGGTGAAAGKLRA
jgi:hypothetical protein